MLRCPLIRRTPFVIRRQHVIRTATVNRQRNHRSFPRFSSYNTFNPGFNDAGRAPIDLTTPILLAGALFTLTLSDDKEEATQQRKEPEENTVKETPTASTLAHLVALKSFIEKGKFQEAGRMLMEMLNLEPSEEDAADVHSLLLQNRVDEAISLLTTMLKDDPHNRELHKTMAWALILRGKYTDALFWLDEAIWVDPKGDVDVFVHRGKILKKLNNLEDALVCFEKALLLNPLSLEALNGRAEVLKHLKIESSDDRLVLYCRGSAHFELGHFEEALEHFEKAISIDPKFKEARYNIQILQKILKIKEKMQEQNLTKVSPSQLNIPTHYEYAVMAEAAYSTTTAAVPKGWSLWCTSTDETDDDGHFSRDGFLAKAFINHSKKAVVIAAKGTHSAEDIITDILFGFNNFDRQFICALKFAERILEKMAADEKLRGYELSFTGHSLGAAEAEYLAYKLKKKAVTFESPGSVEIIARLEGLSPTAIDTSKTDVICYLTRPNFINTAKTHLGQLIRIYPRAPSQPFKFENAIVIEKAIESWKKVASFFPFLDTPELRFNKEIVALITDFEALLKETAHWHAMKEIATSFRLDYEEGVPVYQKQIIKWPNTDGFYLVWRLSRESATGEPEEHRGVINKEALKKSNYMLEERDMFTIPTRELSSHARRFIASYKKAPHRFDSTLSEVDKKILNSARIEKDTIHIGCTVPRDEWKAYIEHLSREADNLYGGLRWWR